MEMLTGRCGQRLIVTELMATAENRVEVYLPGLERNTATALGNIQGIGHLHGSGFDGQALRNHGDGR